MTDEELAKAIERGEAIQAERLRASKDADAAKLLAERMSEISEECYCAQWLDGLEFSPWSMLIGADRDYGMGHVSIAETDELRALSEKCGGWIRWMDDVGEVFVPAEDWSSLYAAHAAKGSPR